MSDASVIVRSFTPVDVYHWRVTGTDGATYHEVGSDGAERGWHMAMAAVPSVARVSLLPLVPGRPPIHLDIPAGAVAHFGRRRTLNTVAGFRPTVTEMGWTDDAGGQRWLYVGDDGAVDELPERR